MEQTQTQGWNMRRAASALQMGILMCGVLLGIACKTPTPERTDIGVFIDFTEVEERGGETLLDREGSLNQIIAEIAIPEMNDRRFLNGGSVTFYPINSHGLLRPGQRVELDVGDPYESKLIRKNAVSEFYAEARDAYESLLQEEQSISVDTEEEYSATYIVQPVCQYLASLREPVGPDHRRYVLLYTDFLEHSSVYSFYQDARRANEVIDDRADVADTLLSACEEVDSLRQVAYRWLPHPLPKSTDGRMQHYAQQVWSLVFERLGLNEDHRFAS
jgi:hypothetical protein